MSSIIEIQEEILDEFNMFEDWFQKYEYLIDLGKDLASINEKYKIEENLIRGCQSKVWLHADEKDGKIIFSADSDAIMTKGIIALLIRVFSNQHASEIVSSDLYFINKIGLTEQLSVTRANGLLSMIKQMKLYAVALNK